MKKYLVLLLIVLCVGCSTELYEPLPTIAPTSAPPQAVIEVVPTPQLVSAIPTAVPQVPTVAPTVAPTPTPTVVPTVAPTAVPTVMPTAEPTMSAEEIAYGDAIIEVVEAYGNIFSLLAIQFDEAAADPAMMFDENWRLATAVYLGSLIVTGDMARDITPPARYAGSYGLFLEAVTHIDKFIDLYADGVDELDAEKINAATMEMTLGGDLTRQSTELMLIEAEQ